jgi:hypothetical protein
MTVTILSGDEVVIRKDNGSRAGRDPPRNRCGAPWIDLGVATALSLEFRQQVGRDVGGVVERDASTERDADELAGPAAAGATNGRERLIPCLGVERGDRYGLDMASIVRAICSSEIVTTNSFRQSAR